MLRGGRRPVKRCQLGSARSTSPLHGPRDGIDRRAGNPGHRERGVQVSGLPRSPAQTPRRPPEGQTGSSTSHGSRGATAGVDRCPADSNIAVRRANRLEGLRGVAGSYEKDRHPPPSGGHSRSVPYMGKIRFKTGRYRLRNRSSATVGRGRERFDTAQPAGDELCRTVRLVGRTTVDGGRDGCAMRWINR